MWNTDIRYTRVKLCWFEYLEAAYEASQSGADALGFHILQANSENWTEKAKRFRAIIDVLPKTAELVLLTDYPLDVVLEIMEMAPFACIQLYPDWDSFEITRMRAALRRPIKVMKVMSAKPHENSPSDYNRFVKEYSHSADAILLDSCREGGSGVLADLSICAEIVRASPLPVFLAGGLNAGNVADVIRFVRPFGVDVETGVSVRLPGHGMLKTLRKCYDFVDAVAHVDRELLRVSAL